MQLTPELEAWSLGVRGDICRLLERWVGQVPLTMRWRLRRGLYSLRLVEMRSPQLSAENCLPRLDMEYKFPMSAFFQEVECQQSRLCRFSGCVCSGRM